MLTLRPTKTLARRLGIELPLTPPLVSNRVADWCVHEFRAQRFKYLIFFNTATLYPIVTSARGVTDEQSLIAQFESAARLNLEGTPAESHYRRWIAPELGAVQWAAIPDRSIIGSMNDLVFMAKVYLERPGDSAITASRLIAEAPMGLLGMNSPARAFLTLRGPVPGGA